MQATRAGTGRAPNREASSLRAAGGLRAEPGAGGGWRERDGAPWCLVVAGDRDLGIIACGEMEKVLSKDEVDAKVDVRAWGIR